MDLESLECPICQNTFDEKSRTPRILHRCGHTLCSDCLGQILQGSRLCPFDKKKFGRHSTALEHFHKNFALLSILAERNTIKVCSEHQMKLKYTCLEDGSKICPECVLHGAHKGHEAKLTKALKTEHREKRKKLTKLSENQSLNKKRQFDALQAKEHEIVNSIKEGFSTLKEILQDKELEMIYGAKILINSERKAIFLGSREERNLHEELQKGIKDIESFEKTENYLSIKDKDFDNIAVKSESNLLLQKVSEDRIKRLEQISKIATMETFKHQLHLAQLNAFPKSTLDGIYQHFKTQECQELLSKVDLLSSKVLEVSSCLDLLQLEDTLFVSFMKKRPEILDVDPIQWEQIKRLNFDFSEGNILNEDLSILTSIRFQSAGLTALTMKFNSAKTEQENLGTLLRSMPIFFKQIDKLLELEINLEDCKVNERSLVHIINNFVAKAVNLNRLKVNLDSTLITDRGVQSLLLAIQNLNKLESIWLNLFDTKISDQAFDNIHMLVKTPSKLHLNVQGTKITDKTLMHLAEELQLTMNTIKRLSLNFGETSISDEGVCSLMTSMKELDHFELNIMDTKVQDKGASKIWEYIQKKKSSLGFLAIRLEGTKISEKYRLDLEAFNA